MAAPTHYTTGELAAELGEPVWRVRRAVDALGVELPRAGLYRLIPRELVGRIRQALARPEALAAGGEAAR